MSMGEAGGTGKSRTSFQLLALSVNLLKTKFTYACWLGGGGEGGLLELTSNF